MLELTSKFPLLGHTPHLKLLKPTAPPHLLSLCWASAPVSVTWKTELAAASDRSAFLGSFLRSSQS